MREECKKKVCGKKRHTKVEIGMDTSDLICGRIAAGEKYNLTCNNSCSKCFLHLFFLLRRI